MGKGVSHVDSGLSTLPAIQFSNWHHWRHRDRVQENRLPGVYLLARFTDNRVPPQGADPLAEDIVYIGETSASLAARWRQFHRDAFEGIPSHAGGANYRNTRYPMPWRALHVAALTSSPLHWRAWAGLSEDRLTQLGVSRDESEELKRGIEYGPAWKKGDLNRAWIKYVERKLILDFVLKWGRLPRCNKE
jgi:hypothetical protein